MSYFALFFSIVANKLPRVLSVIENVCESGFKEYTKLLYLFPWYINVLAYNDIFTGNSNNVKTGSFVKNYSSAKLSIKALLANESIDKKSVFSVIVLSDTEPENLLSAIVISRFDIFPFL